MKIHMQKLHTMYGKLSCDSIFNFLEQLELMTESSTSKINFFEVYFSFS